MYYIMEGAVCHRYLQHLAKYRYLMNNRYAIIAIFHKLQDQGADHEYLLHVHEKDLRLFFFCP